MSFAWLCLWVCLSALSFLFANTHPLKSELRDHCFVIKPAFASNEKIPCSVSQMLGRWWLFHRKDTFPLRRAKYISCCEHFQSLTRGKICTSRRIWDFKKDFKNMKYVLISHNVVIAVFLFCAAVTERRFAGSTTSPSFIHPPGKRPALGVGASVRTRLIKPWGKRTRSCCKQALVLSSPQERDQDLVYASSSVIKPPGKRPAVSVITPHCHQALRKEIRTWCKQVSVIPSPEEEDWDCANKLQWIRTFRNSALTFGV